MTASDETARCCVVANGERCTQAAVFHVTNTDGAIDDYTFTCADHLALVRGAAYRASRMP